MPDPTAHADDMKSPATIKPNEMPAFWWVNPWGYALNLKRALHAVHRLSEDGHEQYVKLAGEKLQVQALADLHKTERYDFLRQVEVTLEAAGGPKGYHDTIDLVVWAADEIKSLRASLSVMTEDRDEYIDKLDRERGTHEATLGYVRKLEEKVNHLEAEWPRDLNNGGKIYGDVYTCQPKPYYPDAHKDLIEKYAKADAKRKPAKKKAKKKGGRK